MSPQGLPDDEDRAGALADDYLGGVAQVSRLGLAVRTKNEQSGFLLLGTSDDRVGWVAFP